jgi:ubiquinone/menaquinone biosynthesis C-methylase UbiE
MTPTKSFGLIMQTFNARAYAFALSLLEQAPYSAVLEIGFGSGRFLETVLSCDKAVVIFGVDPTPAMFDLARRKPNIKRAGNRADIRIGDAAHLPWPAAHFDAVVAIHSFQFWRPPEACVAEAHRVLKPGGRLILVLRDHSAHAPSWLPNPISRSGREVEGALALLAQTGFTGEEVDARTSPTKAIVAVKAG